MIGQFHEMDITMLSSIEGGKNNWQTNVLEGGGAAFGGWGLGTAICAASGVGAPFMGACGYIGAKFGVALLGRSNRCNGWILIKGDLYEYLL